MPLKAQIVRQPLLCEQDRLRMLALHRCYFDNVRRKAFLADMAAKDWVIVLRALNGELAGFSTVRFIHLSVAGADCVFLFSGDTVVASPYRRGGSLAGAFGHVMLHMLDAYPNRPCYWFLISKGYRTYRFLPLYFRRFYPVHDLATPPRYANLLRAIGEHLFADAYDAGAGIVRHAGICDRLTPAANSVPEGRVEDPHVAFFLARNPHCASGDELACLADISMDNLRPTCHRLIARAPVEWIGIDAGNPAHSGPAAGSPACQGSEETV